ncbi:MAG: hypothetical protein LBI96_01890 [Odoribacteraceae bacterium]|jgi:hypothetical protein|nr:hypothetical protein [Odoribacteraceae bacterium]
MKKEKFLLVLAAFLVVISSAMMLYGESRETPVYLNIAAMVVLAVAASIKKKN